MNVGTHDAGRRVEIDEFTLYVHGWSSAVE
jgi:hypothetical protein